MSKGHAALLVHDVVNLFLKDTDAALARTVPNIEKLVAAARAVGLPIVFLAPGQGDPAIKHSPRAANILWNTPEVEILATLGPLPGDTVIRKPRWGGFYGSYLTEHLRATGRDTVIVCGISLAGGVDFTVRDAYNRDFLPITVADASRCRAIADQGFGAFTAEEVERVELSILARFGPVMTTDAICREMDQWI